MNPQKEILSVAKLFLDGEDIRDKETDLSQGNVDDTTLDKTEMAYVNFADFFIDMTI